ncbi:MAG: amino acid oxidase [Oscillospiraceae bacterium]|nr:amino acid oxidase [Oscillospiraceae bacterium]
MSEKQMEKYDKIILGAGIYGLYSAIKCGRSGQSVLVLDHDSTPFSRATYINQARVHMGYHYPRSLSTAVKSANYYQRFHEDFGFAIHNKFSQVYATSAAFSWTNADAFVRFCKAAGIKCEEISPSLYFKHGVCDGAFLTEEDTYDALIIRDYYLEELKKLPNVVPCFNVRTDRITRTDDVVVIEYRIGEEKFSAEAPFFLNATYASTNQVLNQIHDEGSNEANFDKFKIKYEQCEIVLCSVGERLKNVGLTVMDGPFFSIMPFGKTPYHSLTAVTFTPHVTSYDDLPTFPCQEGVSCSPQQLDNCNTCPHKPMSAWVHMSHLARKYMRPELEFSYESSLYSMKPILKVSEIDDSRPTAIVVNSTSPKIISVLSGKINTVYDLDAFLEE